jgi:CBS domain-containing protein
MLVSQILNDKADKGVVTVTPETSVAEATRILSERRIGTLVVSATGKTAEGVLSERDIVRELALRGATCLDDRVADIMTPDPSCAARSETVHEVMAKMTEGRFRHMPVMEEGALVGIVTLGDVVKAQLSEVAMEKSALEGMIMGH